MYALSNSPKPDKKAVLISIYMFLAADARGYASTQTCKAVIQRTQIRDAAPRGATGANSMVSQRVAI